MLENSFFSQSFRYYQITETTNFVYGDFSKESKSCLFMYAISYTPYIFIKNKLTDAYHTIGSLKCVFIITYLVVMYVIY